MIIYKDNLFKGVLSIGAYGRAGSGLLLSLLDGHPDCINFQDTILSGYQDWWNSLKSNKGSYVMEDFLDLYQVIFDPTFIHPSRAPSGAGNDFGRFSNMIGNSITGTKDIYVPKESFTRCLSQIVNQNSQETASSFFKKLHVALAFALDKPISDKTIIVHGATNGHPYRFDFLRSGFRNNWNILMVREPVVGHYASIMTLKEENKVKQEDLLLIAIAYMRLYYLSQLGWENCTKSVKIEDLHHSPKETLKKIINWIDIPWDDCLLQSTFLGEKWLFKPNKIYMKPLNPEIITTKKYAHLFTSFDHYRIAICFRKLYTTWGYKFPSQPLSLKLLLRLFSPFKIEKLSGSNLAKRFSVRKMLFMSLFSPTILSKRDLIYNLLGKDLTNILLRSTGRKSHQVRLSKSIIELL